jgi:hypothetical protein
VFVSAEEGEAVDVIDVARREQVAQIAVGARPRGIGFSPDGKRAYVAAEPVDVAKPAARRMRAQTCWWSVRERGMRPGGVVVTAPTSDDDLGLLPE